MELYDFIKPNPQAPAQLFTELGHSYQDRYPVLTPDSSLWLSLFWLTDPIDRTLAEKLEYIRAVGALLVIDQQFGFKIQPIVGKNGWDSMEHYNQERQYLVPHMQTMLQVLGELRRRYDSGRLF